MAPLALCLALACAVGTHSLPVSDPIHQFRSTNGSESSKYVLLREANIERIYDLLRNESASRVLVMKLIEKRFSETPGLRQYLHDAMHGESKRIESIRAELLELKKSAMVGGTICEFEYRNDSEVEWGFLVLKQGSILVRRVWAMDSAPDLQPEADITDMQK